MVSSEEQLPELTDEQKAQILLNARKQLAQQERTKAYLENLKKPVAMPTAEEYFAWVRYESQREDENNSRYLGATGFELTDYNKAIFWALSLYFTNDPRFEQLHVDNQFFKDQPAFSLSKGIALFGPVGCGKTTLLRLFSSNPRQSFTVTPCTIAAHNYGNEGDSYFEYYAGRSSIYGSAFQQSNGGRGFDDLGVEPIPVTHYGKKRNMMADLLDRRYTLGSGNCGLTHLTTNLSSVQIEEMYGLRIRSRMREMFNAIYFIPETPDRRK